MKEIPFPDFLSFQREVSEGAIPSSTREEGSKNSGRDRFKFSNPSGNCLMDIFSKKGRNPTQEDESKKSYETIFNIDSQDFLLLFYRENTSYH